MASKGYPRSYEKGFEITVPKSIEDSIFAAGVKLKDGKPVTSGGRVLGVSGTGDTLEDALDDAYRKVKKIRFDNAFYRKDIGARALAALKK